MNSHIRSSRIALGTLILLSTVVVVIWGFRLFIATLRFTFAHTLVPLWFWLRPYAKVVFANARA